MKLYSALLFFIIFNSYSYSQVSEEWVKKINGTGNINDGANASVIDASGNIIVTGFSNNTGNFASDILTVKISPAGNIIWSAVYNGPNNGQDVGLYLALDNSGNILSPEEVTV